LPLLGLHTDFISGIRYGYGVYQIEKGVYGHEGFFFWRKRSLTWWAIGGSLISSNISAEQFIGMSGRIVFLWGSPFPRYE